MWKRAHKPTSWQNGLHTHTYVKVKAVKDTKLSNYLPILKMNKNEQVNGLEATPHVATNVANVTIPTSTVVADLVQVTEPLIFVEQSDMRTVEADLASTVPTNNAIEATDPYCHQVFAEFKHFHSWLTILAVRVLFVWKDEKANRLLMLLLDQSRDIIAAIVPPFLIATYQAMNLVGGVFKFENFQIEELGDADFRRYGKYSFLRERLEIIIWKRTKFIPLTDNEQLNMKTSIYPKVPSLKTLAEDNTARKLMTDVVGKVLCVNLVRHIRPRDVNRMGWIELFLQDSTGHIMKMIWHDGIRTPPVMLAKVNHEKNIIYATRVKLIHTNEMNILVSTDLTEVVFDPDIPEAGAIKSMTSRKRNLCFI